MQKNGRLQCRLDVYWLLHNFVHLHFTTKQVPAVALGIVTEGLSVAELFRLHCAYRRLRIHGHQMLVRTDNASVA